MEVARINRAATGGQRPSATHLTELPLAPVNMGLVWPLEGALAVVQPIEKLADVLCLHRPLEHSQPLEYVVLEPALVAAHPVVVRPTKHALAVHHLVLELPNVSAAVGPLEDAVLEYGVVLERAGVNAPVGPFFCPLARGAVVLKHSCNHGAVGEPVAPGPNDLTAVPQPFELRAIRPMECAVALQFAVMELPLKPRTVGKHLLAFPFNAIVLELAFVARPISPRKLALTFPYAIAPIANILDAVGPTNLSTAVHTVLAPMSTVHPSLLSALEGAVAILHTGLEIAGVAVAVRPSPHPLAMENCFFERAPVLFARRPSHGALAPHHVLPPLAIVRPESRPRLLSCAPHVPVVELADVLTAIAPHVMALTVHAAIEPSANIGIAVREDPLVLGELVRTRHARRPVQVPGRGRPMVDAGTSRQGPMLGVRGVLLAVDVLVNEPRGGLAWAARLPDLLA
mmetsp:Transcript_91423/g.279799  ORF Transcript_91423/g.279799 Transcript_91423/m.279799 type:complete len:456 (-) Transcript_91423:95-1462(-)